MATKHQVIAAHQKHREWTASDIAAHLGCMREYVVATARRNSLTLPLKRRSQRRPMIELTAGVIDGLRRFAADREVTVPELAKTLLETVSRDGLVDAILDDRALGQ